MQLVWTWRVRIRKILEQIKTLTQQLYKIVDIYYKKISKEMTIND
jgi:hypothetical protein